MNKEFSQGNPCVRAPLRGRLLGMKVSASPFFFFPFRYWRTVAATAV
jgi:hypothetical protein